jgi:hypothetical protein
MAKRNAGKSLTHFEVVHHALCTESLHRNAQVRTKFMIQAIFIYFALLVEHYNNTYTGDSYKLTDLLWACAGWLFLFSSPCLSIYRCVYVMLYIYIYIYIYMYIYPCMSNLWFFWLLCVHMHKLWRSRALNECEAQILYNLCILRYIHTCIQAAYNLSDAKVRSFSESKEAPSKAEKAVWLNNAHMDCI